MSDKLKERVRRRQNAPSKESDVDALLCRSLYLAQVRFTPGVSHVSGKFDVRNHAKVIAVDDSAFYIGSENIYPPVRNMEFGLGREHARLLLPEALSVVHAC